MTIYAEVNAKRKTWLPVQPTTKDTVEVGVEDLVSRCLALRVLELPVREFILEGLSSAEKRGIGTEGIEALRRNTEDEDRHDKALSNCVQVFTEYRSRYEQEAAAITKAWQDHADSAILKAAVLENGIFFVLLPLMRRFGGASLRTTAIDISADEAGHVVLHRYVAQEMDHKTSKSLDNLRKATIDWVAQTFDHTQISAEKIRRSSDNLMYKGVAPDLSFSRSTQVPAFFERGNDTLPYYS